MINPFFSIIIISVSVLSIFLYEVPLLNQIKIKETDLQVLEKGLEEAKQINNLVDETTKTLRGIDPVVIKRLEIIIPEQLDEVRFANNLYNIGFKNNLFLENIKINKSNKEVKVGLDTQNKKESTKDVAIPIPVATNANISPESKFVMTKISFDLVASYAEFQALADDMEKSLGIMNIERLEFHENTGSGGGRYLYKVELVTYSIK